VASLTEPGSNDGGTPYYLVWPRAVTGGLNDKSTGIHCRVHKEPKGREVGPRCSAGKARNMNTNQKSSARLRRRLVNTRGYLSVVALLVFFVVFAALAPRVFLTLPNLYRVLQHSVITAISAMGLTFPLLLGGIDLSIGAVFAFVGIVGATLATAGGLGAMLAGGLVVGLVLGLVNGTLHVFLRIPSFVVTLGMMLMLQAAGVLVTGGREIILARCCLGLGTGVVLVIVGAVVAVATWFIISGTKFGENLRSIGNSEPVAKELGVPIRVVKIGAFALCGLLAGLAGLLNTAYTRFAVPDSGSLTYLLSAMVVVFLGGTSITGSEGGSVWGIVVGAIAIALLENGMVITGVPSMYQPICTGAILLAVVAITTKRRGLSGQRLVIK